jgi:hypothetical protein
MQIIPCTPTLAFSPFVNRAEIVCCRSYRREMGNHDPPFPARAVTPLDHGCRDPRQHLAISLPLLSERRGPEREIGQARTHRNRYPPVEEKPHELHGGERGLWHDIEWHV